MSEAHVELLFALADDELLLGYRDSEWTGIAPLLEEDVALSSIAQDEVGHAYALYTLAAQSMGKQINDLVFRREPQHYRHCRLLEAPRGNFAFTIARRFVYEIGDAIRLESLLKSSYRELSELSERMLREEALHADHAEEWMACLSRREPGRSLVKAALCEILPAARKLLAPLPAEAVLLAEGVLPQSWEELSAIWEERVRAKLDQFGFSDLGIPKATESTTDRFDPVSPEFATFHRELLSVYSIAPHRGW
jgi:ring-1,2-phenylacetyl-CoA epoxidase subunit PaaC